MITRNLWIWILNGVNDNDFWIKYKRIIVEMVFIIFNKMNYIYVYILEMNSAGSINDINEFEYR